MPMPYTLTKGPLLTLLENGLNPTLSADPDAVTRRNDALKRLRGGDAITSIPWVTSGDVAAVAIPQSSLDTRLDQDWFGKIPKPGGGWDDQPAFNDRATGYWVGYYGDVESVLREGLIRAIEVSLGIDHGDDPGNGARSWPIEVHWKCPNPYFEVWVSWRRHGAGPTEGQVSLILATPPDKSNRLVTEPQFPPPPEGQPAEGPLPEPVAAPEKQGMWLVAHAKHTQHIVDQLVTIDGLGINGALTDVVSALLGLPDNEWAVPMPTTFWEDGADGTDVVVVAPPTYAGGADPTTSNAP